MKTILLTGASGYLGGNLLAELLNEGYQVIALCLNKGEQLRQIPPSQKNNIIPYYLDTTPLSDIFNRHKIDIIIHTATLYGRKNEPLSDILLANVHFPLEVLSLAIAHQVNVFINTDTILVKNITPYALTKSQFLEWLDLLSDRITVVNMRLDHFYGPDDNPVKFIAWLITQLKNKVPHLDLTEGAQTRDFVYIKDVISAYTCILDNLSVISRGKINHFEIGTNIKTSIKTLVLTLKEMTGNTSTTLHFGTIPYRKYEVLDYKIDTSALQALGWKPAYNLQQGLTDLFQTEGKENK